MTLTYREMDCTWCEKAGSERRVTRDCAFGAAAAGGRLCCKGPQTQGDPGKARGQDTQESKPSPDIGEHEAEEILGGDDALGASSPRTVEGAGSSHHAVGAAHLCPATLSGLLAG